LQRIYTDKNPHKSAKISINSRPAERSGANNFYLATPILRSLLRKELRNGKPSTQKLVVPKLLAEQGAKDEFRLFPFRSPLLREYSMLRIETLIYADFG